MRKIMTFLLLFFIIGGINAFAQTKADTNRVEVNIEGLSCPFCAYGLEKKIKEIDGTANIKIDVQKGLLTFSFLKGKKVTEQKLRKIVKSAGFTPKKIKFSNTVKEKREENKR